MEKIVSEVAAGISEFTGTRYQGHPANGTAASAGSPKSAPGPASRIAR
jgi:hypothetical protein